MRFLLAFLMFIAVSVTTLLPFGLIAVAFSTGLPFWGRTALVFGGLIAARLIKPLSIITGRDLKII